MANGIVAVKLTWEDTSTGARDEIGQEIDIWTDSPSFVPNVPINYTEARHPWMRLPPIAAGETEAQFRLEAPVTFVTFRVRQYNANGSGGWSAPAGTTFTIQQTAGPNTPEAPANPGFVITDGGIVVSPPPPPPPPEPTPTPPPTGTNNYVYATQFSGVQGQNGWSYKDATGTNMTYNSANAVWNGSQTYMGFWAGGAHPGSSIGVMLRWTVPGTGVMNIGGTTQLYSTSGNTGVTVTVKRNASTLDTKNLTNTAVVSFASTGVAVTAGDTIDFIVTTNGAIANNSIALAPSIQLTSDGTTPTNPTVSSVSPTSLVVSVGGVEPVIVTLSSAPSAAAVVSLSSSDPTKATVPATVTVPAGQTTAVVSVTGVAAGATTVTATYNSSNKASSVAVSNPASGTWSNAPAGGTVLFDSALNSLTGLIDDYPPGSTPITISDAPFSPSMGIRHRLEALAKEGGGQVRYSSPVLYREMYAGMYWRSNPQFQGRTAGNKVFFLRGNPGSNGVIYWIGPRAAGGGFTAPLFFSMNGQTENKHILGPASDSGSAFGHNVGNSTVVAGVWYKLEWRIRCSTTLTSQDGILQMWLNGVLTHSYLNINYSPHGLNEWVMNQTWDGSGDMGVSNTMAWEYYLDHLIIVGKN